MASKIRSNTMEYEILAKVKFNDHFAVVLNCEPPYVYRKVGGTIYGTDGFFYKCYQYERPCGRFKAFAGREFNITLEDGEVIKCNGQWWDTGVSTVEKITGVTLCPITWQTIDRLKKCYVFTGSYADKAKYLDLLNRYSDLPVYAYYDYVKIIKYDDMRSDFYKRLRKLEKAKTNLIKEVKEKHRQLQLISKEQENDR